MKKTLLLVGVFLVILSTFLILTPEIKAFKSKTSPNVSLLWSRSIGGNVQVDISGDGRYMTAASVNFSSPKTEAVYMFNTESSTPLWSSPIEYLGYHGLAISRDGQYVITSTTTKETDPYDRTGRVRLFSRNSNDPLWTYTTKYGLYSASISADGSYMVVGGGSQNKKVYFFERSSGTPVWICPTGYWVLTRISADGNYIVSGGGDDTVRLFSKDSNEPICSRHLDVSGAGIHPWIDHIYGCAISYHGNYIAIGTENAKVYLFSKDNCTPTWNPTWDATVSDWIQIDTVCISDDGSYITAAPYVGDLYLFHRSSSTPLWTFHAGVRITAVCISGDGEYIVSGSEDHQVRLFRKDSNEPIWSYTTGGPVHSVSISNDGKYLCAGSGDGKAYLFGPERISATVDIDPDTLNLVSKGKWITCYIELPEGYDVNDIDVSTILLNDTITAEMHPAGIGDEDDDGIPDLMVKFDRAEVTSYIIANVNMTKLYEEKFMTITLTITGNLNDDTPFKGSDTIRIKSPLSKGLKKLIYSPFFWSFMFYL